MRGMKRVKQFEKVEMFRFVEPDDSEEALDEMVEISLELCRRLGFTTRLLKLCAGDIAFQSAKTYDIEVWSPGAQEWLEISSLSTCTDFQARRNNTRYRPKRGSGTRFPAHIEWLGAGDAADVHRGPGERIAGGRKSCTAGGALGAGWI